MSTRQFYVAPNGRDSWSGTLDAPTADLSDGPFATLFAARNAIRALRAREATAQPTTVLVRGGKYYLSRTLVLGPEDAGTRDAPITYSAYPGETPMLSGGRTITAWSPYRGAILQAELPGARGGKWKFRQLFCNGRRQIRARYPNFDPENPIYGGWSFIEGPAEPDSMDSFVYRRDAFPRAWSNPSEGEVNIYIGHGWHNDIVPIAAVDREQHTIALARSIKDYGRPFNFWSVPLRPGSRFYVENLLEELDQPGEWCLDSEAGRLYFWPPVPIEQSEVVVPALDCLVALHDTAWITLSGFTLTETTDGDNLHHDGGEGYGPMFPVSGWRYCGDAVHLKGAEHCTLEDNRLNAVGGNAIYLEGPNLRNTIRRNEIDGAGANGIVLLGSKRRHPAPPQLADPTHPARWRWHTQPHPQFNRIEDNHIHHCGALNKYVAGVFLGVSDGNTIAHNLIEDMPHHAINLGSNRYGRNLLEYNLIRRVCREIHDTGAINAWMEDEFDSERCGHVIRYNAIYDVEGCHFDEEGNYGGKTSTFGIYLDNYTSNCLVYGNLIVRCSGTGIVVHCGKNNLIENNLIVAPNHAGVRFQYYYNPIPGFLTGNRFCRNVIVFENPQALLYFLHGWSDYVLAECDYNLFATPDPQALGLLRIDNDEIENRGGVAITYADWRHAGYDEHSLIADPAFVDALHDDYRLRPDSPAHALGVLSIDPTLMGPRRRD